MVVSVVTPNYNGSQFIERTINSVLAQRHVDVDYVVVDDGSTDCSRDIIRRYAERGALRLVEKNNGGLPTAINAGFRAARGQCICWLDSDNLLLPGALAAAARAFEQCPSASIVYGDYIKIDEDDRVTALRRQPSFSYNVALYGYLTICNAAVLFNRNLLERVSFADETLPCACDMDLYLRLSREGPVKHVKEVLGAYRVHRRAMHLTQRGQTDDDTWALRRRYGCVVSTRVLRLLHLYYKCSAGLRMVREGAVWSRLWPVSRLCIHTYQRRLEQASGTSRT